MNMYQVLTHTIQELYAHFMIIKTTVSLCILFLCTLHTYATSSLAEQFVQTGYTEFCNENHGSEMFDSLYAAFDELILFLHANPTWKHKLYSAKERFIRSKERGYYATDFFGFYDESERRERNQISFYYSLHFHACVYTLYPECKNISAIARFFEACCKIQEPCGDLFDAAAGTLGLETVFSSDYGHPPLLLKVIKYLPSYNVTQPHYDGTAFSLFLDSTDNQSLLLSPYKAVFTPDDFASPLRKFSRTHNHSSMILIPGQLLTEYGIYPTPHMVIHSGKIRYATIAFAMRPHYTPQKNVLSPLPNFKH